MNHLTANLAITGDAGIIFEREVEISCEVVSLPELKLTAEMKRATDAFAARIEAESESYLLTHSHRAQPRQRAAGERGETH